MKIGVTIHLKATEMLFHVWLFSRVSKDIFANFVFLLIIVNHYYSGCTWA